MSALVPFEFEGKQLRARQDGWFIAADVCAHLAIKNSRQALARLDDDEKGVISNDTLGGAQDVAAVNEPGLYSLTLSSKKPEAKRFKRWVTHDVLPALRKTGQFSTRGHAGGRKTKSASGRRMVSMTIKIMPETQDTLRELAKVTGHSMSSILDQGVEIWAREYPRMLSQRLEQILTKSKTIA